MDVCILDAAGEILVHRNVKSSPEALLEILAPDRDGLLEHFPDPAVRKRIEVDLALVERYGTLIADLELTIVRHAKRHDADAVHRLRSVPGIGKILALTLLYEIHDVTRCDRVQPLASWARLVKCAHESAAGKKLGRGGAKQGNVHLKWAFSEAAVLYLRHATDGKKLLARLERKHGKGKALSILAHRLGRAVYDILARGTVFSPVKELLGREAPSRLTSRAGEPVVSLEPRSTELASIAHRSIVSPRSGSPCV